MLLFAKKKKNSPWLFKIKLICVTAVFDCDSHAKKIAYIIKMCPSKGCSVIFPVINEKNDNMELDNEKNCAGNSQTLNVTYEQEEAV